MINFIDPKEKDIIDEVRNFLDREIEVSFFDNGEHESKAGAIRDLWGEVLDSVAYFIDIQDIGDLEDALLSIDENNSLSAANKQILAKSLRIFTDFSRALSYRIEGVRAEAQNTSESADVTDLKVNNLTATKNSMAKILEVFVERLYPLVRGQGRGL